MVVSAAQLRAARSLLGLSQPDVALAAHLSTMTVKRAEGAGSPSASRQAVEAIQAALEAAGVEFIAENGGGAGVRLRRADGPRDEGKRPEELDATNDD